MLVLCAARGTPSNMPYLYSKYFFNKRYRCCGAHAIWRTSDVHIKFKCVWRRLTRAQAKRWKLTRIKMNLKTKVSGLGNCVYKIIMRWIRDTPPWITLSISNLIIRFLYYIIYKKEELNFTCNLLLFTGTFILFLHSNLLFSCSPRTHTHLLLLNACAVLVLSKTFPLLLQWYTEMIINIRKLCASIHGNNAAAAEPCKRERYTSTRAEQGKTSKKKNERG